MWKMIALLLLMLGFILIYQHQDRIMQKVEDYLKAQKTISKVNGASMEKERALIDAQKQALEY